MNRKIKHLLAAATAGLAALFGAAPGHAADVGVSVSISQPGVYGRVDIGRFPPPSVIVNQPVIVHRAVRVREPVYLWVPPGHRKNWSRHCGQYGACGAPVYFVSDRWYDKNIRRPWADRDDWRRDDRDGRHDHRHDHRYDDRGRKHDDRRGGRGRDD